MGLYLGKTYISAKGCFRLFMIIEEVNGDKIAYKLNSDFKKYMQEVFRCLAVNLKRKPRQRRRRRRNKRTAAPDLKRPSLFFLIIKKLSPDWIED